jgi:hypothetical protein
MGYKTRTPGVQIFVGYKRSKWGTVPQNGVQLATLALGSFGPLWSFSLDIFPPACFHISVLALVIIYMFSNLIRLVHISRSSSQSLVWTFYPWNITPIRISLAGGLTIPIYLQMRIFSTPFFTAQASLFLSHCARTVDFLILKI